MTYAVKEAFLTLQGEGAQTGGRAVFLRFAGCNLWSGREEDRAEAVCTFCDTDFVGMDGEGGGRFADAEALGAAVEAAWRGGPSDRLVVLTGGEPLLQVDAALIAALHARGFEIAVETNGTLAAPEGLDWICVSPKADAALAVRASAYLSTDRVEDARTDAAALRERFPRSELTIPTLRRLAEQLYEAEKWDAAAGFFQEFVEATGAAPEAAPVTAPAVHALPARGIRAGDGMALDHRPGHQIDERDTHLVDRIRALAR